jgi:hypothetical protein
MNLNAELGAPGAITDLSRLAQTIRATPLEQVPETQLEDVVQILNYIREQTLKLHEETVTRQGKLAAEQQALTKAQEQLKLREQLVAAREALAGLRAPVQAPKPSRLRFWG